MGKPLLSAPAATPLKMRVEGMDCGACAVKIENALKRLPGVSEINVNYGVETLTLRIDQDRTSSAAVQQKIRALGYTSRLVDGNAARISSERIEDDDAAGARPWWQTPKGRRVIAVGAMFVGAFAVSTFVPAISYWAYFFAALIGLAPFARRALTAAISGTPFSIEMLMSIAAIGAVVIGAAEEATVVVFLLP